MQHVGSIVTQSYIILTARMMSNDSHEVSSLLRIDVEKLHIIMQIAAERRQTAMLGALAMLAGFLALNKVHFAGSGRRRLFHATVVVLSLANGAVGLASLLLGGQWQRLGSN